MSSNSLQLWQYRDTEQADAEALAVVDVPQQVALAGISESQVEARVRSALQEAEQRWIEASRASDTQKRLQLQTTLQAFAYERAKYFRELEGEVVHLALAVARKILMREATLDPDLLAGLVRVALDRLSAGAVVKVYVPPTEMASWQNTNALIDSAYACEVIPDASLPEGDCRVETDRGTASFGLEGQLKEIERGLLDVLARRPPTPAMASDVLPTMAKVG